MVALHVEHFGLKERPALVLLHGFLGSGKDWSELVGHLTQHFYVLCVDLPGHGKSSWEPSDSLGFGSFCNRLEFTFEKLQSNALLRGRHFYMMGYSLGGRLAMVYALSGLWPLRGLILEGSNAGLDDKSARLVRKQVDERWAGMFRSEPLKSVLTQWYQQPVFSHLTHKQVESLVLDRMDGRGESGGEDWANALISYSLATQPDFHEPLSHLSPRANYIFGQRDIKFGRIGQQMLLNGSIRQLFSINNCGHNAHKEQPAAVADVVRSLFLE